MICVSVSVFCARQRAANLRATNWWIATFCETRTTANFALFHVSAKRVHRTHTELRMYDDHDGSRFLIFSLSRAKFTYNFSCTSRSPKNANFTYHLFTGRVGVLLFVVGLHTHTHTHNTYIGTELLEKILKTKTKLNSIKVVTFS